MNYMIARKWLFVLCVIICAGENFTSLLKKTKFIRSTKQLELFEETRQ